MPYLGNVLTSFNIGTNNIDNGAVTTEKIADGAIINADVNASAAIAGTKISPDFGSQTVQTTGIFSHALGTAGAPTVTFTGDTNTGIYSPGADQLAISTGGSGRLFIDASGRVGVGTSSFTAGHVFAVTGGYSSLNGLRISGSDINNTIYQANGIGITTADYLTFATGSSLAERLRITATGLVGIGTTSPATKLEVRDGVITAGDTADVLIGRYSSSFPTSGAGYFKISTINDNTTSGGIAISTLLSGSFNERFRITSAGDVCIGTTSSAGRKLNVFGGVISNQIGSYINTTNTRIAAFEARNAPSNDTSRFAAIEFYTDPSLWYNGDIRFVTNNGDATVSAGTERMRIDSAGRLFVGTAGLPAASSSTSLVHINGSTQSSLRLWSTNQSALILQRPGDIWSANDYNDILWQGTAGGGTDRPFGRIRVQVTSASGVGSPTFMSFYTNGDSASDTERMRIDSAGRVGIGTSSPSEELHVVGDILATGYNRIPNANEGGFFDVSGNNGITIKGSTNASPHITTFYNSGVASVTIDASRRVGIGTTSPDANLTLGGLTNTGGQSVDALNVNRTDGLRLFGIKWDVSSNEVRFSGNTKNYVFRNGSSEAETARIDSSGRLLVGTSTAPTVGNAAASKLVVQAYVGSSTGQGILSLQGGNPPTNIFTNERIAEIGFNANNGSPFAEIFCAADGTAGTNDYPGRLVFSTTADGASSPTERMRIANNGAISTVVPGGSTLYPAYDCRAWVNFDGTGTVAIRASGNVSSITDNGTGNYTVNFTTAMPDANYSFATQASNGVNLYWASGPVAIPTSSAFRFGTGTGTFADLEYVSCAIFR